MIEPTVEHRASSRRPGPPSRVERLRAGFDVAAGWLTLCYGIFLGGSALAVIGVAALFVGAHMSGDEAALGVLPAAAIAVIGGLITLSSRRSGRPAPGTASPRGRPR